MSSVQYRVVNTLFKILGVNKMLDKHGEDFEKLLNDYKEKQKKPLKIPYKKLEPKFNVDTKDIDGTREVMIAYLKDFQAVCKRYDVKLTTHIGKGMMHCWGAMEFVPEAKAVRKEYFEALR